MNRKTENLILKYYGITTCHAMTQEELLIEQAENSYVPYTAEDF